MISVPAQFGAACRWLLHSRHSAASIAHTIAARFMLTAIGVVTGVITARALGNTGRGEQAAMTLLPMFLPYLLTLGMATAVRYRIRLEPERATELFTVAVLVATVMSLVALAVGVTCIPVWLHQYSGAVIREAQIIMAFSPQVTIALVLTAMLETTGEFKLANSTRVISTTLHSVLYGAGVRSCVDVFVADLLCSADPDRGVGGVEAACVLRVRRLFDPRARPEGLGVVFFVP